MNFSWAMDLDPKGTNNRIKEAIDKRYVTDDEDPATEVSDTGECNLATTEVSNTGECCLATTEVTDTGVLPSNLRG